MAAGLPNLDIVGACLLRRSAVVVWFLAVTLRASLVLVDLISKYPIETRHDGTFSIRIEKKIEEYYIVIINL